MPFTFKCKATTLALLCFVGQASAATINAQVQDSKTGDPLGDAVVIAIPKDTASLTGSDSEIVVDQIDKEFVRYVTPAFVGQKVQFPNRDEIRHHVYSFSETKNFEIPLYKGTPTDPVKLNTAGEIILGCNIHDWMKGFIYVSESPYFARSDATGQAVLSDLPAGQYDVQVWHPNLQGEPEKTIQLVDIQSATDSQALTFELKQKKVWKAWRSPTVGAGSYN
jgi:plastocyanin